MRTATTRQPVGFTLIEVLIAIGILSLVIASIYSTWTAILRASKSGQTAAAAVQRTRIVVRLLEDSLSSAQCFGANVGYYGFIAENGDEAVSSRLSRQTVDWENYRAQRWRFGTLKLTISFFRLP